MFFLKYVKIIFYCENDGISMNIGDTDPLNIKNKSLAELNFITVASLDFWQGYD
ncbi:MAG: hypothetical protein GY817_05985 [bacterium]|nr:hypothetical protein [bacterium]